MKTMDVFFNGQFTGPEKISKTLLLTLRNHTGGRLVVGNKVFKLRADFIESASGLNNIFHLVQMEDRKFPSLAYECLRGNSVTTLAPLGCTLEESRLIKASATKVLAWEKAHPSYF